MVYSIDGPVFFGAAERLQGTPAHIQRPATTLILRMGEVPFVDATGRLSIEDIIKDFKRHGSAIVLTEVRTNVHYQLERAGILAHIGADDVVDTLERALARADILAAAQ